MRKVCFIGNSSLACIKTAWDEIHETAGKGIEATFFAASAHWMNHLKLQEGFLLPAATDEKIQDDILKWLHLSSDGKDRIALAEYDAFVLCGGGFRWIFDLLNNYATADWVAYGMPKHLVSTGFFMEMVAALFKTRGAHRVAADIRKQSTAPIIALSEPCATAEWLELRGFGRFSPALGSDIMNNLYADYCESSRSLFDKLAGSFLVQPDFTLDSPGFTKKNYNSRGIGVAVGTRRDGVYDGIHMNKEYGAIVLNEILPHLG